MDEVNVKICVCLNYLQPGIVMWDKPTFSVSGSTWVIHHRVIIGYCNILVDKICSFEPQKVFVE